MSKLPIPCPIDFRYKMRSKISNSTYSVHGIDKYPAKLIPQAARYLLQEYIPKGSTVLDTFCGTGSVLVEASLSRFNSIGIDLNPLATLFASVKTTIYSETELNEAISKFNNEIRYMKSGDTYNFSNIYTWFTPQVLNDLSRIQKTISLAAKSLSNSQTRFLIASLARIVRECSKADSKGPKPFISKKARCSNKGINVDVLEKFYETASFIKMRLLDYSACFQKRPAPFSTILTGDTRDFLRHEISPTINAIITSPPYINAQDYYRSSKLELRIARLLPEYQMLNFSRSFIGTDRGKMNDVSYVPEAASPELVNLRERLALISKRHAKIVWKYFVNMKEVFHLMSISLKPGSIVCIVVGQNRICGIDIPTHNLLAFLAESEGFKIQEIFVDIIQKRHLPPKRNKHKGIIDRESVLVMSIPAKRI